MKKIQSGQGVTDLGSQMAADGDDLMGRVPEIGIGEAIVANSTMDLGEPQLGEAVYTGSNTVDKPVLEGTPDWTVTFTGRAAEEYHRAKDDGFSDESAFIHAERVQKLIDAPPQFDFLKKRGPGVYTHRPLGVDPQFVDPAVQALLDNQARALGQHTCTYDDHGEDSDCWVCNPAAAHRGQPPGVDPEASGGPLITTTSEMPGMPTIVQNPLTDEAYVVGDDVNHPPHYNSHPSGVECIEIARWMMFDPGNALKYVMREEYKGQSRKDAEKSRFYLTDALSKTGDVIWGLGTTGALDEAKKKLLQVAEGELDFVKAMFYHALYEGRMERALRAVNALIDRAGD